MLEFGEFRIDFDRRLLFERGRAIVLAPKVFDVLAYLVRNYGRVVSKDELNAHVWDGGALGAANIPQHILLLRRALRDVRKPHKYVGVVHGEGYAFVREPRSIPVSANGSVSLTAQQLYSNARYLCEQRTAASVRSGLQIYDAAIAEDPGDAKLHAGKALAHLFMANYLYASPADHVRLAHRSATRALELDASSVDALGVLATLALTAEYDPARSLMLCERIASERPDLPLLYQLRAQCFTVQRRFDEALISAHEGVAWHPASLPMNALVGYALYAAGRYADAEAHLRIVLDLDRESRVAAYFHAMSRYMLGAADAAIEELRALLAQRAMPLRGQPDVLQHAGAALAFILHGAGKAHEARAVVARLAALSEGGVLAPSHRAIAIAPVDEEAAAAALDEAINEFDPWAVFAPVSHFFDAYEDRAWYGATVRRLRTPRTMELFNSFSTPG